MNASRQILLSALDWGMGHTGRCVHIVRAFQALGCHVHIACNPQQEVFFSKELQNITYHLLAGYDVQYPIKADRVAFALSILKQLPKILSAIKREATFVKKLADEVEFTAIISDNRYGFKHSKIPSIIICHQVQPIVPILGKLIHKVHASLLNKFSEVWIPDNTITPKLSGELCFTQYVPRHRFIGILPRLTKSLKTAQANTLLVVLTGPPQAKLELQNAIIAQQQSLADYEITIVGNDATFNGTQNNVTLLGIVDASTLSDLYAGCDTIISRCGYTTLMDLCAVQRHAILIATTGQTEQEYLAQYVSQNNWHSTYQNIPPNLANCIEQHKAQQFKVLPTVSDVHLHTTCQQLLQRISQA